MQVIPEHMSLWNSHLISPRSSMKRCCHSPSEFWLQRGSLWLKGPAWLCSKELAPCPFLNSCMSSSLLTTSSFSSGDSALLGPNIHCPHQPYEGCLTALFVHWKYFSKTGVKESLFNMSTQYFTAGSLKVVGEKDFRNIPTMFLVT